MGFRKKLDDLFGIDIRALAIMRIAFALLLIVDRFRDLPFVKEYYSDAGLLPIAYGKMLVPRGSFSLFFFNGSLEFQYLLLFALLVLTVGLLVGYYTRFCTVMIWVLLVSMHNRNWLILGAEDKLLDVLFLWFIFLPWGACYSIDRLRHPERRPPVRVLSMGSAAFLLQVSFFYIFTGFLKSFPEWTRDHDAGYLLLSLHEFVKPLGTSLLSYPKLLEWMTVLSLNMERFGPFFFFIPFQTVPFRFVMVIIFVIFHLVLMVTLETGLFQWVCLIMFIGFLPTAFFDRILGKYEPHLPQEKGDVREKRSDGWAGLPWYLNLIVGFLILYGFCWNLHDLLKPGSQMPKSVKWIGCALNLRQHWGMFAPGPMRDDGWFVIPGRLRNGTEVDLMKSDGAPVVWEEPPSIMELNRSDHLTLYYMNIHRPHNSHFVHPWGKYLCREWNATHSEEEQVLTFKIIFMERMIQKDLQPPKMRKVVLFNQRCF